MSGILTLDIGNSDTVAVLYGRDGKRRADLRRPSIKEDNFKKYRLYFRDLNDEFNESQPEAVILSCVVPFLRDTVLRVMEEMYPESRIINVAPGIVPEMNVLLEEPRELGADLIATNAGAYHKYRDWTIIADLGSATKLGVIDGDFNFYGGVIIPGIAFQASSLHQMIPHLPDIELKKPERIIGSDTIGSIQSGIINGTLAAVLELARRIETEMGHPCRKVITGGLAKLFDPADLEDFQYDEFLLSEGLFQIALCQLDTSF